MKRFIFFFVTIAALIAVLFAAEPPSLLNYQGVLRDAFDDPLDGSWDMTFRFYDAETVGNEILIDQHLASGTGPVIVTDGMFNAQLGGGAVSDGSGPRTIIGKALEPLDAGIGLIKVLDMLR